MKKSFKINLLPQKLGLPAMNHARNRLNQGFSLVELMIAMVLGLVLLIGVISIFDSTRHANRVNDALGQLQENGRIALEFMARDIRSSGNAGCNRLDTLEIQAIAPAALPVIGTTPIGAIRGFNAPTDAAAPPAMLAGTNAIYLSGMTATSTSLAAAMATQNAPINYAAGGGWRAGDTLLLSDCLLNGAQASAFIAPAANNGAAGTIPSPAHLAVRFPEFANLGPLYFNDYFVADLDVPPDGVNSLYVRNRVSNVTTPLVDGVENMAIRYGVDTNANGTPDVYLLANAVGNWNNVTNVEVSLLLRDTSTTNSQITTAAQSYRFPSWAAADTVATDLRLRTVMGINIALRNRLP